MNTQANAEALAIVQSEIDARAYWDEKSEQFFVHYPSDMGGYDGAVAHLSKVNTFGRYVWVVDVTGDTDRLVRVVHL